MAADLNSNVIEQVISNALDKFYQKRLEVLNQLQLNKLLKRKNPYLFRAKGITKAQDVIEELLFAFMSSSEETIFGNIFFEEVALAVSGGKKSSADSVDIEIHTNESIKIIAVKSGTSVFNAQSKKRQQQAFQEIGKRLSALRKYCEFIVGYGYGKKNQSESTSVNFKELAGQEFWEELTGDSEFYLKIARLMKNKPQQHAEEYKAAYKVVVDSLTKEFSKNFCDENGDIDWDKWIKFNSEKRKARK